MYSELLNNIFTVDDAVNLLTEVLVLKKSLYGNDANSWDDALNNLVRKSTAVIVNAEISKFKNEISKIDYLLTVERQLMGLKSVKLILACEPSIKLVETIALWLKANVGRSVVLDITLDKKLIGGAIVEYDGKYGDFSLKSKLELLDKQHWTEIAAKWLI
jgi:F0F1-type ATP synthase delta subunit